MSCASSCGGCSCEVTWGVSGVGTKPWQAATAARRGTPWALGIHQYASGTMPGRRDPNLAAIQNGPLQRTRIAPPFCRAIQLYAAIHYTYSSIHYTAYTLYSAIYTPPLGSPWGPQHVDTLVTIALPTTRHARRRRIQPSRQRKSWACERRAQPGCTQRNPRHDAEWRGWVGSSRARARSCNEGERAEKGCTILERFTTRT